MLTGPDSQPPTVEQATHLREALATHLVDTPVLECPAIGRQIGSDTRVVAKLEFLQRTGTFKARGALSVLRGLDAAARRSGVTAVSAGNHAIAVAYAARQLEVSARVVMLRHASPLRVQRCREYGADVVLADDVHSAFTIAEEISRDEGRFLVHPFEGHAVAVGTGTLGLELCRQVDDFEDVVIPVGGGGLCGGMAAIIRQLRPTCRIYAVEPFGADSLHRSLAAGRPQTLDSVETIADSLGAPFALPYSFELCRQNVDEVVRVSDDELRAAMRFLFRNLHVAVEPACAASTAAAMGPLAARLAGRRVVLVFCGSNIDWATFARHAGIQ